MTYLTSRQRRELKKLTKNKSSSATRRITRDYERKIRSARSQRDTSGGNVTYGASTSQRISRTAATEKAQVEYAKETKKQQQTNIEAKKQYSESVKQLEQEKEKLGVGEYIRRREALDKQAGVTGYTVEGEEYKSYGGAAAATERQRQSRELRERLETQKKETGVYRPKQQGFTKAPKEYQESMEEYNTKIKIDGKYIKIGQLESAGLKVTKTEGGYTIEPKGLPRTIEEAGFTEDVLAPMPLRKLGINKIGVGGLFLEDLTKVGYAEYRAVETEYRIKLAQTRTTTERERLFDWRERKLKEIKPSLTKVVTQPFKISFEKKAARYTKGGDVLGEIGSRIKRLDIPIVDITPTPSGRAGLVGVSVGLSAIAAPSFLLAKAPATTAAAQAGRSILGFAVAGEVSKGVYKASGSEAAALASGILAGSAISMGPRALYRISPVKIQTAKLPGQKIGSLTFRGKPVLTGVAVDKTIQGFRGQFKGVVAGAKNTGLGAFKVSRMGQTIKAGVGRVKFGVGTKPVQPLALPEGGTLPYTTTMASTVDQSKFTTALVKAAVEKQPNFIQTEVQFMQQGIIAGQALQKAPSPRLVKPDFSQVKVLQSPGLKDVGKKYISFLESEKSNILIKGSLSDYAQASEKVLPKFESVPVKDIDIKTTGYTPEEFIRRAQLRIGESKVRGMGQKLQLYDSEKQKFVEVSDIKETPIYGEEGETARLGLQVRQKPMVTDGFVMQRMSEQVGRRLSTMLEVQRKDNKYFFSPKKQGRVFKDTFRFMEINAPSLREGLSKSYNPLNWRKAYIAKRAVEKMRGLRQDDLVTPIGFGKSIFFTKDTGKIKQPTPKDVVSKSRQQFFKEVSGRSGLKVKPPEEESILFGSEEAYYKAYPKPAKKQKIVYPYYPIKTKSNIKGYSILQSLTKNYPILTSKYKVTTVQKTYPVLKINKTYKAPKPIYLPNISSTTKYPIGTNVKKYSSTTYPGGYPQGIKYPVTKLGLGYPASPVAPSKEVITTNIPTKGRPSFPILTRIKEDKKPGYDVLVKRTQAKKGKGRYKSRGYSKVNKKPLSKAGAFLLGAETVDKYSNRSFKLKKSKKPATGGDPLPNFVKHFKNKVRQKKGNKNVFVEKTEHAIDSLEEKMQIPYESVRLRNIGVIPYARGMK